MVDNFANSEIIMIVEAVAREKNIAKESVLGVLEEAVRSAARRKYGNEHSIKAEIDRRTGEIRLFRQMLVVANDYEEPEINEEEVLLEEMITPIRLADALCRKADAEIGEVLLERLPPIDLGRVAALSAKQTIFNKIKEIEREKQFEEFKDRVGHIVSGIVDKVEYGNVVVKLGQNSEGVIRRDNLLPTDKKLRQGDRVRALLVEVSKEGRGPQIVLSRTHNEFLSALFAQEVPEIYDNLIEIKAVARDPGQRSKVAVFASDRGIDPVGSCVGMRGSRVQAIINELGGEKIDIIIWSSDPATMVVNALAPAEVSKVIIDEDKHRIEVVIADDQLSVAIGKRGQNVRLASLLMDWHIDILTEANESKRRNEEFKAITEKFMQALDVEEILAQLLASEGFSNIQELADASIAEIAGIEGLDEGIATELVNRARDYAETHVDAAYSPAVGSVDTSKLDQRLLGLPGMNVEIASRMYVDGIISLEELADLAHDEFIEKVPVSGLSDEQINDFIMAARHIVYFKS